MLFDPLKIRDVVLRNRIAVSPMCQYASEDGFAADWHLVHLGSRAVGGAGLVMAEAAAVEPRGRISPYDLGIWKEDHILGLERIAQFIAFQGAVPGIQLAHAGRKASTARPWEGGAPLTEDNGGWRPLAAPSPIPFEKGHPVPEELTVDAIAGIVESFLKAAERAAQAGFRVLEIHAAHGYLIHEFLSPVTNKRDDTYGGSFENRTRLLIQIVRMVRSVWPVRLPLFVRISATDWLKTASWDIEQSIRLGSILRKEGVDLIDCSSGGLVPHAHIHPSPGFQVSFAERIRKESVIMTGAVGLITSAEQAETILESGQADIVLMGREFLRDPYWPLHAGAELKQHLLWPERYRRALT